MIENHYLDLLKDRKKDYKSWVPVYCAALRNYIHFTARGFNHLRFHIDNTPRNPREVMYKIGLLPLVRPAIHKAKRVEYEKRLAPVGGTRRKILEEMEYWGITEIVGKRDVKVKVVLRRIGKGEIHFWSIMKLGENKNTPM